LILSLIFIWAIISVALVLKLNHYKSRKRYLVAPGLIFLWVAILISPWRFLLVNHFTWNYLTGLALMLALLALAWGFLRPYRSSWIGLFTQPWRPQALFIPGTFVILLVNAPGGDLFANLLPFTAFAIILSFFYLYSSY